MFETKPPRLRRLGEACRELGIVGAKPLNRRAIDGGDDDIGQSPHARLAQSVL